MAKLLISCDNSLYYCKGKYYFKSSDWKDFYDRYLRVFETIRIANRVIEEKEIGNNRILIDNPRIEVVRIPHFSGPKQYLKNYFKIGKFLKGMEKDCDAAIFRLPSTIAQRICNFAQCKKIPYAVEVVYDTADDVRNEKNIFLRALYTIIDKQLRKACNNAKGVSYVTKEYLQKDYPSALGAFTSSYSSLSLPEDFYTSNRKYPTTKPITIAHVANQVMFNGRKGYNQLIDAVKLLRDQGVEVRVSFAGPSYNNGIDKLKNYAKNIGLDDCVEFVGFLTRKELSTFLDKADLFVLPTRAEGLPRVIIEAMAKGLPCITTNISGNSELVSSDFLFDYDDVEKLAELINVLIADKELYEKTSRINYEKSLEYEASVLQQRRDAFYEELKKGLYNTGLNK